jgi:antitoxin CptB
MDNFLKQLHYQSNHRGTLELDLYLGNFANLYLKDMSEQQLVCYQNLLQEEDADLWDWLHEIKQPPVIYLKIITDIKGCVTKWL